MTRTCMYILGHCVSIIVMLVTGVLLSQCIACTLE